MNQKKGEIYVGLLQIFWELEISCLCNDRCSHLISDQSRSLFGLMNCLFPVLLIFIAAVDINYL